MLMFIDHDECQCRMLVTRDQARSLTVCSNCKQSLAHCRFIPMPIPFVKQKNFAHSIVVKPSKGSFSQYIPGKELHIGIAQESGEVFSFWTEGVEIEPNGWDDAIVLFELPKMDMTAFLARRQTKYRADSYSQTQLNCFDFVMDYLRFIGLLETDCGKEEFARRFVVAKLKSAHKYVQLLRRVQLDGPVTLRNAQNVADVALFRMNRALG